jgi:hypothetical protein
LYDNAERTDWLMDSGFRLLPGLPAYGPLASAFPAEWGRFGREGLVVEFSAGAGTWVANFRPGLGGLNRAFLHPNGHDVAVIASGDLWVVNPIQRSAELLLLPLSRRWRFRTRTARF